MTTKRKDLKKKLASLSALGAGTLAFGVGTAEAGIVYSGPVEAHVGYGPGGSGYYASPNFGSHSATFAFFRTNGSSLGITSSNHARFIAAYGCGCLQLAQQLGLLQLFDAGAKWTTAMIPGSTLLVGGRIWGNIYHYSVPIATSLGGTTTTTTTTRTNFGIGQQTFTDKYALFQFFDQGNTLYGWIHLSFFVTPNFGSDPSFGPDLFIHDWAYDDSGAALAAGDGTASGNVPEPATIASSGIAALALGAVGLRRWRKTRKAA